MSFQERRDAKRQAQLDDIDQRVADGSLTIRKMTDAERERFGLDDADKSFRRFFFPGSKPGTRRGEDAYQKAARAIRAPAGSRPTDRRIFSVETKVDGKRRLLQVGDPATEGGSDVVQAIFELHDGGDLVVSTSDEPVALRLKAKGADVVEFA